MKISRLAPALATLTSALWLVGASHAADLAPHRAVYDMRVGVARHNSGIIDIRGSMIMETSETCDGWESVQRVKLHFSHNDAEESESDSSFASYETRDGLNFRFNTRNLEDGELDDEFSGLAALDKSGGAGKAIFSQPEQQEFALPAGTLFPTMHVAKLIDRALAGETIMSFRVFDGSRLKGAFDVNAVVTGNQPKTEVTVDSPLLKNHKTWVVRLAYFSPDKNVADPDYEMAVELQSNGVTRSITLDYGDFTVVGELRDIQLLPRATKCK